MIVFLEGTLIEKHPTRAVLQVGGIGYELLIPLSSYDRLPAEGDSCRILTHFHVREDAQLLFGFVTAAERELFRLLLSVSGIGPKIALSALSGLSPRDLKSAILEGDLRRLSSVSGIGKKMAERMTLELRDKFSEADAIEAASLDDGSDDHRLRDATLALVALGYKQINAQKMLQKILAKAGSDATVEDLVRRALTA